MTTIKKLIFIGCMGILSQCATTSPSQSPSMGGGNARVDVEGSADTDNSLLSKGCPLDKLQWLYASQQFDKAKQNQLAEKITQSAQADAATMDRLVANKNTNPMAVSSALKTYIEQASKSRTPVSDEFYQQYVNSRMTMCAVIDALRSGSIKQEDSPKVAGNTFRDVAKSFEKFNN
ncbi:hypothetical protein [Salmonirosea aquatica]|uniref:Uncharacterized protein n=1 Tax=Salmonirosea aquatica TaxID=2654236 RepID=A0A7C9FBT2_9BACT|nr:hypothetical protein [Cytophagaceae bacterium SJW1-29]